MYEYQSRSTLQNGMHITGTNQIVKAKFSQTTQQ